MANKEVNTIGKGVQNRILLGQCKFGLPKTCEEIIKENVKEYRGLFKAGEGSERFRELLVTERAPVANMAILNSQQNLSLQQLS